MSTVALTGLINYLCDTLTTVDMRHVADSLNQYADKHEQPLPQYTKEELLARAEAGRLGIAKGEYIEFDDMMRELEEDMEADEKDTNYEQLYRQAV